jgi:uncharacterized protein with LGFP repeats
VYRLTGLFRTAWRAEGLASGSLGWPTSSASKDTKLKLTVQKFQKGVVIADSKRYAIVGSNEWALAKSKGVGTGPLGWPKTAVKATSAAGGGEYQKFTAGTITWRAEHGAIFVKKVIWDAATAAGGITVLGWPLAAATTDAAGKVTQKFEHGTITWTKAKGAAVKVTSS